MEDQFAVTLASKGNGTLFFIVVALIYIIEHIIQHRQLTVLVVGLDNSGKTCTSRALVGGKFLNL